LVDDDVDEGVMKRQKTIKCKERGRIKWSKMI
jgi:hypothetical protein